MRWLKACRFIHAEQRVMAGLVPVAQDFTNQLIMLPHEWAGSAPHNAFATSSASGTLV